MSEQLALLPYLLSAHVRITLGALLVGTLMIRPSERCLERVGLNSLDVTQLPAKRHRQT